MPEQYIYAVARIRNKELHLLGNSFMDSLLSAKNYTECLHLLSDHGWNNDGDIKPEQLLGNERAKTWKAIAELVPDMSVFNVFLYSNDYHNLKAAIKQAATNRPHPGIYFSKDQCTVDPEIIQKAAIEHDFSALPEGMRKVAAQAQEILLHTGDGQLCDIIIDQAALCRIYEAGTGSGNDILKLYSELTVACADIKTAIRACMTHKDAKFLQRALAPCASLDIKKLSTAACDSPEAIYDYLIKTDYEDAVAEIRQSPSAFERWCDNRVIRSIKPQIHNCFTLSPIAAYILARENEIKSVRIVLSGKINHLSDDSIRERVREMYV